MICPDRVVTGLCPVQVGPRATIARSVVVFIVVSLGCLAAAQAPPAWRYDLRPGDHLTYRYTLQRRTQSDEDQAQTEARFRTHVLVAGVEEDAAHISLGFQRNREAAELTEYRSKGKDRLAKEQIDFQRRMQKRPSRFSEAMEISPTGQPRSPWELARETYSNTIQTFHEVMSLPPIPLAKGAAWRDDGLMGLNFQWVNEDDESIHGKLCHRVAGTLPDGSFKLTYWWSPESGVIEQAAYETSYSNDGAVHETARMELESRARGETIESWLASADTRLGALQALLQTTALPISGEQLAPVLTADDPAAQSLALAVAFGRKIELPAAILDKLRQSTIELVQTQLKLLAQLFSHSPSPSSLADECHRPLPVKSPPVKRGTVFASTEAGTTSSRNDAAISYLLRIPLSYREDRPSPLLVYLSGGAGYAMDGMNTAEDVVSQTDYLVLYPQAAGYWWTPEIARRFDAVLNDVLERYNVDRDRIYLTGFSNGGTGALYYATLWPQRFAAVVSLMGAGQCNEQVKAGLPNLKNLPLLFVHGENDPRITPDCSTTTDAALSELNPAVKPELKILPNRAHDITLQSDDGLTLAFFKDKIRNAFPRTVDLIETDALAARGYWVEILDGKVGKSDIDTRIKADNTIEIHSNYVKSIHLHLRPELLPKAGDIRIVWNGKRMFSGPMRDYCSIVAPSTGDPKLDLADTRDLVLP